MLAKSLEGKAVRIRWKVAMSGYEIRLPRKGEYANCCRNERHIFPRRGSEREYDIALGEGRIFADLLEMEETEEAALAFACKWGTLGPSYENLGNSLERLFLLRQQFMRVYRDGWNIKDIAKYFEIPAQRKSQKWWPLGEAEIVFCETRGPQDLQLLWYVKSLHNFCWLEVVEDRRGNSSMAICKTCGQFFTRRSISKGPAPVHCSDKCRQRHSRALRNQ
jgi:hypothetical protein